MIIVFEGLDRTGKSTQIHLLAQLLLEKGLQVHHIAFPMRSTPTGQLLDAYLKGSEANHRLSPQASHLLFSANRWEQAATITEWHSKGHWVLIDRYWYSGFAYSVGALGLDWEWAKGPDFGLPKADFVIYLQCVDPALLAARGGWGQERYERLDLQRAVGRVFEALLKAEKEPCWSAVSVVSAAEGQNGDLQMLGEGEIFCRIREILNL